MSTLNWLTRETDLKAAANAEYHLLVEEEMVHRLHRWTQIKIDRFYHLCNLWTIKGGTT